MDNSTQTSTVSIDIDSTTTANAGRYSADAHTAVGLNPAGQPVAFRRVAAVGQPGSFATSRVQIITPRGVQTVSRSRGTDLVGYCRPLN
jgi:hypothetical protein